MPLIPTSVSSSTVGHPAAPGEASATNSSSFLVLGVDVDRPDQLLTQNFATSERAASCQGTRAILTVPPKWSVVSGQ
jgi:hypothetical protein